VGTGAGTEIEESYARCFGLENGVVVDGGVFVMVYCWIGG
jgi:hypothetical protein